MLGLHPATHLAWVSAGDDQPATVMVAVLPEMSSRTG
jgi:hypothetical protein